MDCSGTRLPSWNYNVSHHGDYVAIASEPHLLVGTADRHGYIMFHLPVLLGHAEA